MKPATIRFQSPNRDSVSSRLSGTTSATATSRFNPLIGILFLHARRLERRVLEPRGFNPLIGILFLHAIMLRWFLHLARGFNPLIGILFLHARWQMRFWKGCVCFNPLIGILFLHASGYARQSAVSAQFQSPNRDSVSSRVHVANPE